MTRRRWLQQVGAIAWVVVGAGSAWAQADEGAAARRIEGLLQGRVAPDGPGVAVLVARGDQVVFRGARGLASIELGVPLTADQVFRIGSISKQFSAAALLRLAEAGRARLDDRLSTHLPDYPNAGAITLAQLLNHSAGIPSYYDIPGYTEGPIRSDLDTAGLIAVFKDRKPDFAPGAGWSYSDAGYVLVGAVIEAITGRPWHEAVAAITGPLGLTHTGYGDHRAVRPGMAEGYGAGPDGQRLRAAPISMTQAHAGGALVSSVDDLWRWSRALHGGRVVGPESYRRMTTPEGPAIAIGYGYGLLKGAVRDQPALMHAGGMNGYAAMLLTLQDGLTVALLRNSDDQALPLETMAREMAAIALGRPYPDGPTVTLPASDLQRLVGRYRRQGATDERLLSLQDGTLVSQRVGGQRATLRSLGRGVFRFDGTLNRIEVDLAGSGPAPGLRFYPDGDGPGQVWLRVGD